MGEAKSETIELASPTAAALGSESAEDLEALASSASLQKAQSSSATEASEESRHAVTFAILLYGGCSSSLLIINKLAMWLMPDASFILFCQFLCSSIAVRILKMIKPEMDIELIHWSKAKPFLLATAVFYMCLLSNTKALESVNVETVIVVRSCSPIAVAFLEHATLGRELPSPKGMLALTSIAGGAAVYVLSDEGFVIHGYMWLSVYFVFIVTEMVFVKFVVDTVPMSTWTRVYYNNTLSLPMAVMSTLVLGDSKFMQVEWDASVVVAILLSCMVGVAISYAGFNLRQLVTATSFTVVGVVCKIVTILVNDLMWSMHSNAFGHVGLLICIGSGFWYERCKAEQREQAKSVSK